MPTISFFLSKYESPDESNYQHAFVVLAEGLTELNISFKSNINHWFDIGRDEYLIKKRNDVADCDYAVYSNQYIMENDKKAIFGKKKILIDLSDGPNGILDKCDLTQFDLILKAHYNRYWEYSKQIVPWAFGLSNRIIRAIDMCQNIEKEKTSLRALKSFRVDHTIRSIFSNSFFEDILQIHDYLEENVSQEFPSLWAQTGKRHNPKYFEQLNEADFVLAYGGYLSFKPTFPRVLTGVLYRLRHCPLIKRNHWFSTVYQYDSWRLWEAFYSQAIPIHLDFEKWGFVLPINPTKFEHYLPISFNRQNFKKAVTRLDESEVKFIKEEGKKWAHKNYSPRPTAERFLSIIDF